jgi:hypothetical protein
MNLLLVFLSVWLYHVSSRLMCVKMYVQVAYSVLGNVGILKLLTNCVLSSSCRRDIPSCISYNFHGTVSLFVVYFIPFCTV